MWSTNLVRDIYTMLRFIVIFFASDAKTQNRYRAVFPMELGPLSSIHF